MRYTSRGLRGGHVTSMKRVRSGHCANKANLYTDFPFFPFRALQKLYQKISRLPKMETSEMPNFEPQRKQNLENKINALEPLFTAEVKFMKL